MFRQIQERIVGRRINVKDGKKEHLVGNTSQRDGAAGVPGAGGTGRGDRRGTGTDIEKEKGKSLIFFMFSFNLKIKCDMIVLRFLTRG